MAFSGLWGMVKSWLGNEQEVPETPKFPDMTEEVRKERLFLAKEISQQKQAYMDRNQRLHDSLQVADTILSKMKVKAEQESERLFKQREAALLLQRVIRGFQGRQALALRLNALLVLQGGLHGIRCRKLKKQRMMRKATFMELFETEKNYVQDLEILHSKFRSGMISFSQNHSSELSMEEINKMIPLSLTPIWNLHKEILLCLQPFVQNYQFENLFSASFMKNATCFHIYSEFISNYDTADILFKSKMKDQKNFKECILKIENSTQQRDLSDFLIAVVQRVPRYNLLFQEIMKFTPENHPDFLKLSELCDYLIKVTSSLNEKKREAEELPSLLRISQLILDPKHLIKGGLVQPHRHYIKEGPFKTRDHMDTLSGKQKAPHRYGLLFSDLFIVARPARGKLTVLEVLPTSSFESVMSLDSLPLMASKKVFGIGLQMLNKKFLFLELSDEKERRIWVKEFEKVSKQEK